MEESYAAVWLCIEVIPVDQLSSSDEVSKTNRYIFSHVDLTGWYSYRPSFFQTKEGAIPTNKKSPFFPAAGLLLLLSGKGLLNQNCCKKSERLFLLHLFFPGYLQ
jgi:hypothetical protein